MTTETEALKDAAADAFDRFGEAYDSLKADVEVAKKIVAAAHAREETLQAELAAANEKARTLTEQLAECRAYIEDRDQRTKERVRERDEARASCAALREGLRRLTAAMQSVVGFGPWNQDLADARALLSAPNPGKSYVSRDLLMKVAERVRDECAALSWNKLTVEEMAEIDLSALVAEVEREQS